MAIRMYGRQHKICIMERKKKLTKSGSPCIFSVIIGFIVSGLRRIIGRGAGGLLKGVMNRLYMCKTGSSKLVDNGLECRKHGEGIIGSLRFFECS